MSFLSFEFILYIRDQVRSRVFYAAVLGIEPTLDVSGMTEFDVCGIKLGLMPAKGIKKLLGDSIRDPDSAHEVTRCELYLTVDDPAAYAKRALMAGARMVDPQTRRDWGDEVVYLADPDNHIIAFARRAVD